MKKTYICPSIDLTMIQVRQHLMTGSSNPDGTSVYDTEASSSEEVLSRRSNSIWNEDEEEY